VVGRFYTDVRGFVRPIVRLLCNPLVSGLENVPPEGGFVIASNHLANIDSFMITVVLPRAIRLVAKESLWKQKGPHGVVLRWFFDAVGAVPVD
ncbi:1-acyl-sn-glycerol-3-phosphate acyltransferase, partial [Bacillus altitudinis]